MAISVGIDLGTTFSAVAYIEPRTQLPKIIPNREEGNRTNFGISHFKKGLLLEPLRKIRDYALGRQVNASRLV